MGFIAYTYLSGLADKVRLASLGLIKLKEGNLESYKFFFSSLKKLMEHSYKDDDLYRFLSEFTAFEELKPLVEKMKNFDIRTPEEEIDDMIHKFDVIEYRISKLSRELYC